MKKEMLINVLQPEECRIAIVEDGILEELYVERTSHESYTGNIYKGKIVNLEPAIQAAFVDFSVGRNGFLHVSDVEPQYYNRHQLDEPTRARAATATSPAAAAPPRTGTRARPHPRPGARSRALANANAPTAPSGAAATARAPSLRRRPDRRRAGPPAPAPDAGGARARRAGGTDPAADRADRPACDAPLAWPDEAPRPARPPAREPRLAEPGEPGAGRRGRPSRSIPTCRRAGRIGAPDANAGSAPRRELRRGGPSSFAPASPEIEPELPAAQEPRRGRGRGRATRPPEPEPTIEA